MHYLNENFRCFVRAETQRGRRVESANICQWTARPKLYKKGRGTFRSIRARFLLIFEVEVDEAPFPLLSMEKG
jgi:hypothetical protein